MASKADIYSPIVAHYEACLAHFGDSHRGVDWPNAEDAETRYAVMLDVFREEQPATLLDFGCGASHLYEYMLRQGLYDHITYAGLDISPRFVQLSRGKFPSLSYYNLDILKAPEVLPRFDYIVMNGVFTEKRSLSYEDMFRYFIQVLKAVFEKARMGIAFNVMSKHVDWEREDLFHVPFDELARFLRHELSQNYVFRADYGLYEYTTYVYR